MATVGPHLRTASLVLLVPVAFLVAARLGNIQTILIAIGLGYAALAGGVLWIRVREADGRAVTSADVLLRRGGAWVLLLFTIAMAVLISGRLLAGALGVVLVYVGGVFDQTELRLGRQAEADGSND